MTDEMSFGSLTIRFDDRVLRPRPWTAAQSRWAAELLADAPEGPVLELCTGAGHIGLLAVADGDRRLVAVDLNPAAVTLARANAEAAGMADRVEVREGSMEQVLGADERFVVAVVDPPWVRTARTGVFPEDPLIAIDGGDDGLDVARLCVRVLEDHLAPGGVAVFQLGDVDQAHSLADTTDLLLGEIRTYDRGVLALFRRA